MIRNKVIASYSIIKGYSINFDTVIMSNGQVQSSHLKGLVQRVVVANNEGNLFRNKKQIIINVCDFRQQREQQL
jgi:hypothetical protein